MRIDKFLKVSRIIKRRTIAKEIIDKQRVYINDRLVKSSAKVSEGDEITIIFGIKKLTVKVLKVLESTKKEDANQMYEIISEEMIKD